MIVSLDKATVSGSPLSGRVRRGEAIELRLKAGAPSLVGQHFERLLIRLDAKRGVRKNADLLVRRHHAFSVLLLSLHIAIARASLSRRWPWRCRRRRRACIQQADSVMHVSERRARAALVQDRSISHGPAPNDDERPTCRHLRRKRPAI